jgi:hypothetical protein
MPIKINVRNLINDFLEMYSSEPEEIVLTESIANSLDAGATRLELKLKRTETGDVYSIRDNGAGMSEMAFENSYHAIALSSKDKGTSIGFAGVGGKLYLAMLEAGHSIYTETKSVSFYGASELGMKGDEAVWRRVTPKKRVREGTGTYVEVRLRTGRLDRQKIEDIVRKDYNAVLTGAYGGKQIRVGWRRTPLKAWAPAAERSGRASFFVEGARCEAHFFLTTSPFPEPRGLDLIVLGKKVKGEQWFNLQFEATPEYARRIYGYVIADPLAKLLTTNKQELRIGNDRTWLAFRRGIYLAFRKWLKDVGAINESSSNESAVDVGATRDVTRLINRLLKLPDFADYNPLLRSVSRPASRRRATREKNAPQTPSQGALKSSDSSLPVAKTSEGLATYSALERIRGECPDPLVSGRRSGREETGPTPRPSRVSVSFAHRPELDDEAWIDSEAVVINTGHPTFKKSQRNGEAMTTSHIVRCVFMTLMENKDPSKKEGLDELRRFYKSWAVLKN